MSTEKLERLQLRAKTDHLWLANEVLGYDFQENPHGGLFGDYLRKDPEGGTTLFELDTRIKSRLILWPRGHYKTTGSAVEIIQLILNFPDIRILILSADVPEGKKRLKEVKDHFRKNEKLRKLFPEFCWDPHKRNGNSMEFTSPARKRTFLREPTLSVASAKSLKSGPHYDLIFIDDLVNRLNSRNKEQLMKSIEDYKTFVPTLDPGGYIYVTGTRYSFDDAYGWIQEQIKATGMTHWNVSIRTCWITRCRTAGCDHPDIRHYDGGGACSIEGCECQKFESNGVREVLFPQTHAEDGRAIGFTPESLDAIRKDIGEEDFACQYENNPLAGSQRMFTRELLYSHILYPAQIPQKGPTVMMLDLAYSQSEQADDLVCLVSRIRGGRHYLIDCASGRIPPSEQPAVICGLILRYAPRILFIEKKTGAHYFVQMLTMFAVENKIRLPQIELVQFDNTKGAKYRRIAAVQNVLTQNRLYFMAGLPNWEKIEQQLLLFPKSQRHDDHADCVGLLLQAPTGYENVPLQEKQLPFWLREPKVKDQAPIETNGLPWGLIG